MRRTCLVLVLATLIAGAGYAALGTPNEPITWAIVLNPYSNSSVSPYLVDVGGSGTTVFNPFAVPDVRRAINRYIERGAIRDSILPPGSSIAYSPVRIGVHPSASTITTPGGTYHVPLDHEHSFDVGRMYPGISLWGNRVQLIAEVNEALVAVQKSLPLLQLNGNVWEYDQKAVEVTVLRPTSPTVLHNIATHVGDLLDDCGFTITYTDAAKQVLCDIALCSDSTKHSEFAWSVYVEAWDMKDEITESIPHILAAQAYSAAFSASHLSGLQPTGFCQNSSLGTMPSGFKTVLIDAIYEFMLYRYDGIAPGGSLKGLLSLLPDNDDAYWDLLTVEVMLGMENAVRIFLGFQDN